MSFRYACTRCRLAKKGDCIFDTDLEIKAHLKAIHGIENPRDDTVDDYSAMISVPLPRDMAKKVQKKGSPFHIERES